jgi:aminomethyltransferase
LKEGADVVTGSTHKTFFGPQRGIILSNIAPGTVFEELWHRIETRTFPGHVSNHHLGTMLGLLGATYEMLKFKDAYPRRVIQNAKALAQALHDRGLDVEGDPGCMFTETHQVVLRVEPAKGDRTGTLLESNNIITNPQALFDDTGFAAASGLRLGAQEMTRYGMTEADFRGLAALLAEIIAHGDNRADGFWRDEVKRLRAEFTVMKYCF